MNDTLVSPFIDDQKIQPAILPPAFSATAAKRSFAIKRLKSPMRFAGFGLTPAKANRNALCRAWLS
ncbi:hypothetical protein QS306_11920 [Paraburkholderia bonniea]|uniref:hypothetical protein n=1 Tax=Paraburkholderia bonniea TaxID=2152891 RepID=UPI001292951E|nr:hypothetical protein [Paraburkholderia bonniea]WJF89801.1 hypothetical protein QS306_11920 [Paraburkholderia bonniea]WJF93115.1 hypothetical protein QS308_11930 [Paraburkholderia bonniea]